MPGDDGIVDHSVFDQLLDMDDDDSREFSEGIAKDYMQQAGQTLGELDEAVSKRDFEALGKLGHFLKGSSAAFGFIRVRETCEHIQNYGRKVDKDGKPLSMSDDELVKKLQELVVQARTYNTEAETWLKQFYKL
ncbi:signal transduction histidine kinase [Chytriomyces sp. MP71]|nr:signal transduction histidine kinase [Chytriomyces sp. MP71]